MSHLFLALFVSSCGYLFLAAWLAFDFRREVAAEEGRLGDSHPRFCQVKPVYRYDQETLSSIETFLNQEQVDPHELYICSREPAATDWQEHNPDVVWLRLLADQSRNGKAATLALGERYWTGEVFVISDADMRARPGYLKAVLQAFEDPEVGVVTCLYRADRPRPGAWGHLFESLCIGDFSASVLVARKTEGVGFAMGSTMAIRREALSEIGGFEALEPYLADDFQLGYRARKAGWKVAIAPTVLETRFPGVRFTDALSHQYRWLVTSRVSRPGGHLAFIVTQGLLWAVLMMMVKLQLGIALLGLWCALRIGLGAFTSRALRFERSSLWEPFFLPWKDLLYLGLWFGSLRGNKVRWGERELEIDRRGQIVSSQT